MFKNDSEVLSPFLPLDSRLRRALRYILPYWKRLVPVLALSFISSLLALYLPYLSKSLIDGALLGRNPGLLLRIVGAFFTLSVASYLLNTWSGMTYTRVSAEILFDMRLALYRHLQRLSPRFYAKTRLGEVVSRINNDVGEIQRIAAETALAWFGNILFLLGTIVILLWIDWRLFLLSVALLPLSLWALVHYRGRLAEKVTTLRQSSADIGSFLIETLQGIRLVVTSNAQEREVARFRNRNERFIRSLMAMQLYGYLSGGLPSLILSGSTVLVILYGGHEVIQRTLTIGSLVAFLAYQMRLFPPIQALMGLYSNLAVARVSLDRVHEILDTPPEIIESPNAAPIERVRGEIRFEDVTFSFDRSTPVLDHVTFQVSAGEVLAIVGASGSGKSTIADLLLRLMDPDQGSILLDGHDLRGLSLTDLRRHVGFVDQESYVFHTTIAENLRYGRPAASEAEIAEAVRRSGLEPFIESLPHKLETIAGERGMALSAGERQRIAIARALLANPSVLVMDEATSALDPAIERLVVAGYSKIMSGRTVILITHRLQLARAADRVLVLEGARIVEEGSPKALLEKNGEFARLFEIQQKEPERETN